jgi:hypothetical protein
MADSSIKLVLIIYTGFFLGLIACSLLANVLLRIADHFEAVEHDRSKLAR